MLDQLNFKERTAVELRYFDDLSWTEIAKQVNAPEETVRGWFKPGGRLYQDYSDFAAEMNRKRQERLEAKLYESDEHILTITTNVMRKVGRLVAATRINPETGDEEDADAIKLTVSDFKIAWEIQRVMLGLPTQVRSPNTVFDQEEMDKQRAQIRKIINQEAEDVSTEWQDSQNQPESNPDINNTES